jgi:divalent metal cation (Fe/Co/Zn/Cd) transporter
LELGVRTVASTVSGVIGLGECYIRKMGIRYYVDLQIVAEGTLTVRNGLNIAHDAEDAVLQQVP